MMIYVKLKILSYFSVFLPARRFMMRSLVAARSIEDVQRIFKELAPVGAGFTTNYAQLDETNSRHSLSSLEFFKSSVNVKQIEEETYCHANL